MAESMSHEDIQKHIRVYMMVFATLAVLTVVTVAVAYLHLYIHMSIWTSLTIALLIAIVKGGLVASYFMHLISEKKIIFITLIITVVFLLFMFALFVSAFHGQAGGHIVT